MHPIAILMPEVTPLDPVDPNTSRLKNTNGEDLYVPDQEDQHLRQISKSTRTLHAIAMHAVGLGADITSYAWRAGMVWKGVCIYSINRLKYKMFSNLVDQVFLVHGLRIE
jgi:cobalamin biosynthesis protein CobT